LLQEKRVKNKKAVVINLMILGIISYPPGHNIKGPWTWSRILEQKKSCVYRT